MSLTKFQDHIFLEYKRFMFVYEPSWDCFRPIEGVAWTGTEWQIQDRRYCKDPFDSYYGFGSRDMKEACETLTTRLYDPEKARVVEYPALGNNLEWFRDRRVMLTPCAPRDPVSWKRLHRGRIHTGKAPVRLGHRFTRRARK